MASRARRVRENWHPSAAQARTVLLSPIPEPAVPMPLGTGLFQPFSDNKKKKEQEQEKTNLRKPATGVAYGDVSAKSPSFDRHLPTPAWSPEIL